MRAGRYWRAAVGCALSGWLGGCAHDAGPGASPAQSGVEAGARRDGTASPAEGDTFRYRVTASAGGETLDVEAWFPPGASPTLIVDEDADAFVAELDAQSLSGEPLAVTRHEARFVAPGCDDGCVLRYRYHLSAAAGAIDHEGWAARRGGLLLAPPSTWLLRPERAPARARYRIEMRLPEGTWFATGVFSVGEQVFEAPLEDLALAPYSAFGAMDRVRLAVGGGVVDVAWPTGAFDGREADITAWVREAGRDVAGYFGAFPLPRAQVLILPRGEDGVGFSRVLGHGGATILAPLGAETPADTLSTDWQMTHEMVHLAFPNLGDSHRWLEEGLATYVEPIARARRGRLAERAVWAGFARGMPMGQPRAGDRGLDRTPTWGRTYWGGALFCLLADVSIRERTGGRRSLDDALRAVVRQGGDVSVSWPIERVLAVGDEATGTTVLRELYAEHREAPVTVDLPALFAKLGVRPSTGGGVELDEAATRAELRREITRAPADAVGTGPVRGGAASKSLQ